MFGTKNRIVRKKMEGCSCARKRPVVFWTLHTFVCIANQTWTATKNSSREKKIQGFFDVGHRRLLNPRFNCGSHCIPLSLLYLYSLRALFYHFLDLESWRGMDTRRSPVMPARKKPVLCHFFSSNGWIMSSRLVANELFRKTISYLFQRIILQALWSQAFRQNGKKNKLSAKKTLKNPDFGKAS